ncbi:acyl-CoA desaturase [Roseimaritima ulvae]|uniref:Fatty acid desaturase n=1 Tax=Roseimaritima ulvae TaxID=980254 RepID=A0A5B9QQ04_9BACT|nr:fatty acid desaturase [Roseimaritima ulvae]QEG41054.1 Fatty acid desaturase [Roseimaritima ulvae]
MSISDIEKTDTYDDSLDALDPGYSSEAEVADPQRLPLPDATQPMQVMWEYVAVLSLVHIVALMVFVPWLFTWSGMVLAIAGHFVFGMMGITIGYHRLLTHRGFTCPKWLEHTLAVLGMCNLQDSPARWVAIHRLHHQHSDHQPDPHTPLASFLWSHVGWVVCRHRDLDRTSRYERYVRDLLRDPFYLKLERKDGWFFVFLIHGILITAAGALVGWLVGGSGAEALRYACSWAVWAVAARTVFVLHGTWAVNSITHVSGYRNYETRDKSRNNWLVALTSHGEGWHNNHHAQPRAAAHGHRWWEFDMSWRVIQALELMGLAKNVVRPKSVADSDT